ncbi:MAG: AAA family ATPase [Bacteroidetes bacterium]|nr:MAG: AAA family ATPase [Bacteroidota bacterium]
MENNIKELEIKNFKSIKHIKFNPKRVNVFIGKPNVGKSNILEGMGLMTSTLNMQSGNFELAQKGIIRFRDLFNLFYDEDTDNEIKISTELSRVTIEYYNHLFIYTSIDKEWESKIASVYNDRKLTYFPRNAFYELRGNLEPFSPPQKHYLRPSLVEFDKTGRSNNAIPLHFPNNIEVSNPIRTYTYKHYDNYYDTFRDFLYPPYGENLFTILNYNKELLNEFGGFIEEQGLEFVLDKKENKFIIQKKIDRIVYQVPYSNIADTLRHIIFYLAAIETNKDSVLLFEEPEVHSYPPYIKMLADRIVLNDENQYFISTHSPYMLNTLIDSLDDEELNVVLTYYEDYQTKIKILSAEELAKVQEWKTDIFFNIDRFINHLQEK